MNSIDVGLAVIAVFSTMVLVYEWLSIYNRFDIGVIFFAGLLMSALCALLIRNRK